MKKLAIFVEGMTEQIFVNKLITEIAGKNNIYIETQSGRSLFQTIIAHSRSTNQKYYVLIRDCGGDSTVKSDILTAREKIEKQGFIKIIGLRDVFPMSRADIPKLEKSLAYGVPTKGIPIKIILAVMEIEAWFLGEFTHFSRIHRNLTISRIQRLLNFDPSTDDVESRTNPALDLDKIYKTEGYAYTKKRKGLQRTINCLDYAYLYVDIRNRIKRLNSFIQEIDSFLN